MQSKSYGAFAPLNMTSFEIPAGSTTVTEDMVREMAQSIKGCSPRQLWETQHSVRMVVDFLSRNIGQLGLPVFQRVDDGGREKLRDSPLARALAAPNAQMTTYDLIVALVSDLALFDQAWWMVRPTAEGWEIRPLAVDRVSIASGYEIDGNLVISYSMGTGNKPLTIKQDQLLHFRGWDPGYGRNVSPAVRTLRDVLAEQVASQEFRLKVWENGGQISQYIARPKDAAVWSTEASDRFREGMAGYSAGGGMAGKMPVLEDGMEIKQTRFNAKDEQWAEAAQLALETVARAFHINPAMLGSTGGVSYANVREFRKMLYGETLGPWLKMIQDRINRFLVPMLGEPDGVYVEFNVKAKLAGDFLEQAAVYSSAVGRPWMVADEARALENMTALGGDAAELVTPLNVLVGGQASPQDGGTGKSAAVLSKSAPVEVKAEPDAESEQILKQALSRFFKRQRESVLAKLSAKASPDWWDSERWDDELADELFKAAMAVTGQVAADALKALGDDPSEYDTARTINFLKAVAATRAAMINNTTEAQIAEALADSEVDESGDPLYSPEKVFDDLQGPGRGAVIAGTLLTTLAGFAIVEAGKQRVSGAVKMWRTNSRHPRLMHARMSGETVPVGEPFSNGASWPGDPVLGADGLAGCMCSVTVSRP